MKKIIHIIIIILLLTGLCITEQLLSQTYLDEINSRTDEILTLVDTSYNINTLEISTQLNDLDTYWKEKENILCTFVNHKEIEDIGVEINRTQTYVLNNDKEQATESLNLIKFYINSYRHLLQINLQNIF